ncbi:hypothetical protein [Phenylobacterium sp.]|uniref:M61 family metallopeptidase n=1 Tax=Phenylobacterium sp. TaxID=1871053 RepID=UPI002715D009|nr:hypothetical protein [Phenylobacterium sp.]MDO8801180.1 hypothetical protein [Phenylobacterium sp.]
MDLTKDPHFLAHEYMHSWIPNQVGGLPLQDEARDYWFSEGFTEFYASRALLASGIWSLEDFVARYNEVLTRYAGSPARNFTADQVMAEFWTNPDAQQSPYDRGRLLALRWDRAVRVASAGKLSLDDVLRRQRDAVRAGPKAAGARLEPGVFGACLTLGSKSVPRRTGRGGRCGRRFRPRPIRTTTPW